MNIDISGGIINTFFALVFAVVLVAVLWGLVMYFTEFGSEEGKRHGKSLLLGSITFLFLFLCVYGVVEWIRNALGI